MIQTKKIALSAYCYLKTQTILVILKALQC